MKPWGLFRAPQGFPARPGLPLLGSLEGRYACQAEASQAAADAAFNCFVERLPQNNACIPARRMR